MAAMTLSKKQENCGTCAHWLGSRTAKAGGFATVELVSAGCVVANSKTRTFSATQQCNALQQAGKNLWEAWGALR